MGTVLIMDLENDIQYVLKAYVNGEVVYKGEFINILDLEEEGLRKAKRAVIESVDLEEDE